MLETICTCGTMCVCVVKPGNNKTPEIRTENGQMVLYLPKTKFSRLFPEASNPIRPRKVVLVYQDDRRVIAAVEFPEQKNYRMKQFAPAIFWSDVKSLVRWV